MAQLEIKKMKQGMSYSCKEKTIILNVFKYFRQECPDKCVTEIVRRTAKATGCSEKSIFQFRKEEASVEGFKVPSTTKIRRNININSRDVKYDSSVRQSIKNIIYELKCKNVVPSLKTILKQITANPHLPQFSLMTLRRLIFDMGFSYEKDGNKSVLVEKPLVKLKKEKGGIKGSNKKSVIKEDTQEISEIKPQIEFKPVTLENNHQNVVPASAPITNNIPVMPQLAANMPSHLVVNDNQHPECPKMLPMQMSTQQQPQQQNHIIHPPTMHYAHNMPMMFDHRMAPHPVGPPPLPPPPLHQMPPSDMELHLKQGMHRWMHHPAQPMMKHQ